MKTNQDQWRTCCTCNKDYELHTDMLTWSRHDDQLIVDANCPECESSLDLDSSDMDLACEMINDYQYDNY